MTPSTTHDQIVTELLNYIYETNPVAQAAKPLPLDESLYDLGILDSYGVIELVAHIEGRWSIKIYDSEITKEQFGGVNKMARTIARKLAEKDAGGKCDQKQV